LPFHLDLALLWAFVALSLARLLACSLARHPDAKGQFIWPTHRGIFSSGFLLARLPGAPLGAPSGSITSGKRATGSGQLASQSANCQPATKELNCCKFSQLACCQSAQNGRPFSAQNKLAANWQPNNSQ